MSVGRGLKTVTVGKYFIRGAILTVIRGSIRNTLLIPNARTGTENFPTDVEIVYCVEMSDYAQ